ncbi:MAG: Amylopullulanase precursor [Syntrophorhabdaceae bacterium PtaU1.Bin034]|nr:MAG: Amylopullulanase precursor [Syntrophorhabdaceae bacterium PtaU1.Bin034]
MKKHILVFSLVLLALVGCGKKGDPMPKGLPTPTPVNDLRGDVRDRVLLISFTIPTKNMDGTDVKDLAGFTIMKNCGGCAGGFERWKDIRLTDNRGYTIRNGRLYTYDNDLREGFEYGYRVFPFNSRGIQTDGSNVFSIRWLRTPDPPKNVTAKGEDSKITISWEKENELVYNIYRWENDIYPLSPANPSPLSSSSFTDGNLRNGTQYKYEVRAVRIENNIPYEGEGTAASATPRDMTPPEPPRGLVLSKKDGGVFLSWTANDENDVAGYNVYRIVAGKPEKANQSPVLDTHFLDAKPGAGLRYVSYHITAVDKSGNESGPSREQIIILKE